ncbi:hypothetical protein VP01_5519g1 [Puccinia sorghi]|uniref:Uncharacterized protein n=1 Tax=Puccinia sorghi TaxID=27349 RepID=A0A0L6UJB6_9BASI|nr:hypothetical protein VP01_5519g1 [Puccinia sorghi]
MPSGVEPSLGDSSVCSCRGRTTLRPAIIPLQTFPREQNTIRVIEVTRNRQADWHVFRDDFAVRAFPTTRPGNGPASHIPGACRFVGSTNAVKTGRLKYGVFNLSCVCEGHLYVNHQMNYLRDREQQNQSAAGFTQTSVRMLISPYLIFPYSLHGLIYTNLVNHYSSVLLGSVWPPSRVSKCHMQVSKKMLPHTTQTTLWTQVVFNFRLLSYYSVPTRVLSLERDRMLLRRGLGPVTTYGFQHMIQKKNLPQSKPCMNSIKLTPYQPLRVWNDHLMVQLSPPNSFFFNLVKIHQDSSRSHDFKTPGSRKKSPPNFSSLISSTTLAVISAIRQSSTLLIKLIVLFVSSFSFSLLCVLLYFFSSSIFHHNLNGCELYQVYIMHFNNISQLGQMPLIYSYP